MKQKILYVLLVVIITSCSSNYQVTPEKEFVKAYINASGEQPLTVRLSYCSKNLLQKSYLKDLNIIGIKGLVYYIDWTREGKINRFTKDTSFTGKNYYCYVIPVNEKNPERYLQQRISLIQEDTASIIVAIPLEEEYEATLHYQLANELTKLRLPIITDEILKSLE